MSVIRRIALLFEIAIFGALILATRCANYENVFVGRNVYFADADCYARMMRVRICAAHPGTIVRHHDFENFPGGTNPHTTAPLDYSILALAVLLKPFSAHAIDLAGALISPLWALFGGWLLWWWSRRMKLRYRWAMLLLYAISPILVHGTELGRPDHQSFLILLVAIACCAEWSLQIAPSQGWILTSGIAWGLALWVSLYEPLILLLVVGIFYAIWDRRQLTERSRRLGWIVFAALVLAAFLVEQRLPSFPLFGSNVALTNWSRTIGELAPVRFTDPIWFRWCGWVLIATPFLIWGALRREKRFLGATGGRALPVLMVLLTSCYLLTLWQARWGYFFALLFAIALPVLLDPIKSRTLTFVAVMLCFLPVFKAWDERLWPNESESARRALARREAVEWRALAMQIKSEKTEPFLAPWWLSPSVAYWSGQPAIAGSSHESLPGIAESSRFYLTSETSFAHAILERKRVKWVLVYDSDRVLPNSAALLNMAISMDALGRVLDRNPSRAPEFLHLARQNGSGKLYRVNDFP